MEFWPEFLGKDGIKEFAAGGLGGMAGVIAGYPLDTVRIRIQQPQVGTSGGPASPFTLLKEIVKKEGPFALYKGMASPLATVAFQNAVTFHAYAALTRNLQPLLDGHHRRPRNDAATPPPTSPAPPSYRVVALAGMGAGALQTLILTPVDLVKIQLQLRTGKVGTPKLRGSVNAIRSGVQELRSSVKGVAFSRAASSLDAMGGKPGTGQVSSATPAVAARGAAQQAPAGAGSVGTGGALGGAQGGPIRVVRGILQREGVRGLYRGLGVTVLRDAPSHGVYFATYEWMREMLHPGCRGSGNEGMTTMLVAGGTAGAASWLGCYPIDVCKSRLQAQGASGRYSGLADCLRKSVREEGLGVRPKTLCSKTPRWLSSRGISSRHTASSSRPTRIWASSSSGQKEDASPCAGEAGSRLVLAAAAGPSTLLLKFCGCAKIVTHVCVRLRVGVRVRIYVCVRVRVCVCMRVFLCVCVCVGSVELSCHSSAALALIPDSPN